MADARTTIVDELGNALGASKKRRDFLKMSALGSAAAMVSMFMAGCGSDSATDTMETSGINFGGPTGPLNLLYATAQLQADFYARITTGSRWPGFTTAEGGVISAISSQKSTLYNALAALIPDQSVSRALLFDFRSVDFTVRTSCVGTAQKLEDIGLQAAHGAVALATTVGSAMVTAKVASAFARHAALLREITDLIVDPVNHASFDSGLASGLETLKTPTVWYTVTDPYFKTNINIAGV